MKKILVFLTVIFCLTFVLGSGLYASAVPNEVAVVLDGEALEFDVPGRLIGDRTMVPLRGIFESLGATVDWDGPTRTVTSTKDDVTVKLTIGKPELYKNGELHYTMDVVPVIIEEAGESRTLVPVRAVAEAFDCLVDWEAPTRTAIITSEKGNAVLANENASFYTIVYEAAIADAILGEINSGANIVRYGIGQNMKVITDKEAPPSSNEIVIGRTNRDGTKEFCDSIFPGNYAIKFDPENKRVYIAGGSLKDTIDAVSYFFNTYADKENKIFSVPYTLDYRKNDSAFTGKHEIYYGKSLFDAILGSDIRKGTLEYDSENTQLYSKYTVYPSSKAQILFSQTKSGTNIFSYDYYVIKYFQSQENGVLDTCVTANGASAKKVYPDFELDYYERWGASHPDGSNGVWKIATVSREGFDNAPAAALPHPDMTNQNLRFKPWHKITAKADSYFGIEYIGLFENEEDAYNFARKLEKLANPDVPVKSFNIVSDGKEITEISAYVGSAVEFKLDADPITSAINIEMTSDNPEVVKAAGGRLLALSKGTANITFTANEGLEGAEVFTKTLKVTVTGRRIESVKIDGVDIAEYKIVIPEGCDVSTKYAGYNISDYFMTHLGYAPEVVTDSTKATSYEILVGNTNRPESKTGISFKDTEYLLYKSGDKIVMQGNGIYVGSAVGEFINKHLEVGKSNVDITTIPTTAKAVPTPDFGDEYENVILMIGDGMGFNHINATLANGLDKFVAHELPVQGSAITRSYNSSVTDSAASATALATGYKTNNGVIGKNPYGVNVKNVRELAFEYGAQTAVITNDAITGATPGGFLVHNANRGNTAQISDDINALKREDKIDYIAGAVGSTIIDSLREALSTISDSDNPFFIMAEQTHNDGGGHNNNMPTVISATTNYNEEIAYAIQFTLCHPKTVLIVTADHETGGIVPDETNKYGYKFTTTNHSGADVPIFALGPCTEVFDGVRTENIDIARFIAKAYGAETFGQAEELDPAA